MVNLHQQKKQAWEETCF